MHNLEEVLKKLKESQQSEGQEAQQPQQAAAASQKLNPEIFKEKSYWCRYFDYSNGKDPENVIMQYDRSCKLYNIFGIKGANGSSEPSQTSSLFGSAESSTKPQVLDISDIKSRSSDLKSKELKDDKDFQKGGFYLLQLDKSKISVFSSLSAFPSSLNLHTFSLIIFNQIFNFFSNSDLRPSPDSWPITTNPYQPSGK